jgi:ribonuclease Z
MSGTISASTIIEGLKIAMCGTSSPLPASGRAQACCLAFETPDNLYIVYVGSVSTATANLASIPTAKLRGILLTHYHSDSIDF